MRRRTLVILLVGITLVVPSVTATAQAAQAAPTQVSQSDLRLDPFNPCYALPGDTWTNCSNQRQTLTWCHGATTVNRPGLRNSVEWALGNLRDTTIVDLDWSQSCYYGIDAQFRSA
jgi:hypothetical protein